MPMFRRQAVVLLAMLALALGAVFYLWPEQGRMPLEGRPVIIGQEKLPVDTVSPEKTKAEPGQLTPGGKVVVFVSGAVKQPGVFELPAGSRVEEAVKAAGGFGALADQQQLNLARPVVDGEKIEVPRRAAASLVEVEEVQGSDRGSRGRAAAGGTVRLNSATQSELESLPGIGPSLAGRIIDYRNHHGAFKRIEDVQQVPGIGAGRFRQMKDRLAL